MDIKLFHFKEIIDSRGNLVFLEANKDIPFSIKRIYYLFHTKENQARGFHSHKKLEQCLICIHGSVKILLDDGIERKEILLNNPNQGIYVGHHIWREMYEFSNDAVLLVLASEYYEESDYIRDYSQFLEVASEAQNVR